MINGELAQAFNRIADLMEIRGTDGFRVNSYRRVARFLKSHPEDIAVAAAEKRLTKLPGIGKGIAAKIEQYVESGRIDALDELEASLPPGLPDLLRIQSLGPKKIALVHDQLGVGGLDDLKRVIESGELAELAGFGAVTAKKLAEGIAFVETSGERTPLGIALPIAEAMADAVRAIAGVGRVDIAGSLRRGDETIGDIDLLCESDSGERIVGVFTEQDGVSRVLASGKTKGAITVASERGRELQIDLRVVRTESYGAALQYFSGSKAHNVRLREIAVRNKLRLNEYGLYEGERRVAGETEESIYAALGLPFVPPEIREDRGEFDLDETPSLVSVGDIRGDLHLHTTASDGRCTIDEMAEEAKRLGYEYIAVTDHSRSSAIANGLSDERMLEHLETVRSADARIEGMKVFTGCECDILADGSLDYSDEILAACDVVVASIHARHTRGRTSPTERLLRAIAHPSVHIIGHATGRLIQRRPAMDIDMAAIVGAASEHGTALEVNASWQRLDLKDLDVRRAVEAGVMLAINTDSHHVDGYGQIRLGVMTARRGWARPGNILNTRHLRDVESWLRRAEQ